MFPRTFFAALPRDLVVGIMPRCLPMSIERDDRARGCPDHPGGLRAGIRDRRPIRTGARRHANGRAGCCAAGIDPHSDVCPPGNREACHTMRAATSDGRC
jgi:hypothetical protein